MRKYIFWFLYNHDLFTFIRFAYRINVFYRKKPSIRYIEMIYDFIYSKKVHFIFFLFAATISSAYSYPDSLSHESHSERADSSLAPVPVKTAAINYPLALLKSGITGIIEVQLDIKKTGTVSGCRIVKGLHALLDSSVCSSLHSFQFSPAIENGKQVEAAVSMEIVFDIDSIVRSAAEVEPDFEGYILDRYSKEPVRSASVSIAFKEPVRDDSLKIPINRYLEIIGGISGQFYNNGFIITTTDTNGYFSFRLLPCSAAGVEIIAQDYETTHFTENFSTSKKTTVTYALIPVEKNSLLEQSGDSAAFEITVYGAVADRESIDIERKERTIGLTHYLSKIVLSRAPVRQIPESGSNMLVRSAGPFDNRYIIAGIPMLAPFHFAGHPYADIDGVMITALKKVDVITDRLAGMYSDVNGVMVQADPGVYRSGEDYLKPRPELSVDYSNIGQDFLLSFPLKKKGNDFYQIAFTRCEPFTLKWFNSFHEGIYMPDLGPGIPDEYGNLTFTGIFSGKNLQIKPFVWFAYDLYANSDSPFIPWGTGSIKLKGKEESGFSSVLGGSRQYYTQGTGYGKIYEIFTSLTNIYFKIQKKRLLQGIIDFDIDGALEGLEWNGQLTRKNFDKDSSNTLLMQKNRELKTEIRGNLYKNYGAVEVGLDLLGSAVFYQDGVNTFGDAGFFTNWSRDRFSFGLHSGRVTSRPDIRGLPDNKFRKRQLSTYISSVTSGYSIDTVIDIRIEPYLRIQPVSPRIDPYTSLWDKANATKLVAYGIDFSGESRLFKWLGLWWVFNAAHGYRDSASVKLPYEWEVPWTVRGGMHLYLGEHAHFMLDGIASSGLPYFDLGNGGNISRIPVNYKRLNFGFEYRTGQISHRHLTRFDVYLQADNLLDQTNVRGYYWNSYLEQNPVLLKPLVIAIGARFGFRI